mmetsp:Transcript_20016/g.44891  ORF Transcript_20016/g.44891 Transcript_20016/m.44891 type:complete len:109 (+) Transcript_20016:37-363(+)
MQQVAIIATATTATIIPHSKNRIVIVPSTKSASSFAIEPMQSNQLSKRNQTKPNQSQQQPPSSKQSNPRESRSKNRSVIPVAKQQQQQQHICFQTRCLNSSALVSLRE